jgi:hypothetical protein
VTDFKARLMEICSEDDDEVNEQLKIRFGDGV